MLILTEGLWISRKQNTLIKDLLWGCESNILLGETRPALCSNKTRILNGKPMTLLKHAWDSNPDAVLGYSTALKPYIYVPLLLFFLYCICMVGGRVARLRPEILAVCYLTIISVTWRGNRKSSFQVAQRLIRHQQWRGQTSPCYDVDCFTDQVQKSSSGTVQAAGRVTQGLSMGTVMKCHPLTCLYYCSKVPLLFKLFTSI